MKQLLILSGKGGTGKTTLAGAFIRFSGARAYADCDVDAPNLHLIMKHSDPATTDYYGLPKAAIDPHLCSGCGLCMKNCRFDAVIYEKEGGYSVDRYACEGCGVCEALCPAGAIALNPAAAGELIFYRDNGVFSTARLKMGSGTSGKLVTEVKNRLRESAEETDLAIIDGSPGIGCPVIASMSGVDMVLIVAEPSVSGISDMERIIRTAEIFKVKTAVCINKYNININKARLIVSWCRENKIPYTGKIPYDKNAAAAINIGLSIADVDCPSGSAVRSVYNKSISLLYDL